MRGEALDNIQLVVVVVNSRRRRRLSSGINRTSNAISPGLPDPVGGDESRLFDAAATTGGLGVAVMNALHRAEADGVCFAGGGPAETVCCCRWCCAAIGGGSGSGALALI